MAKTLLFVYGTLKRSGTHQALLAGQEFVGEATTRPLYRLYDCGRYPCLVEDWERGLAVRGELWKVDAATLARLDEYEGVPHTFGRREIALAAHSGPVFSYFYEGNISRFAECGDSWPAGSGEV